LCFQLLEHVDDTAAVVSEIYRVLKNGGYAIVTAPFMAAQHGHPSDFHRFTLAGIEWYFAHGGFTIIESGKQGSVMSVVSELVRFSFLNPYKSNGRVRKGIVERKLKVFVRMDRYDVLHNSDFYSNVFLVVRK